MSLSDILKCTPTRLWISIASQLIDTVEAVRSGGWATTSVMECLRNLIRSLATAYPGEMTQLCLPKLLSVPSSDASTIECATIQYLLTIHADLVINYRIFFEGCLRLSCLWEERLLLALVSIWHTADTALHKLEDERSQLQQQFGGKGLTDEASSARLTSFRLLGDRYESLTRSLFKPLVDFWKKPRSPTRAILETCNCNSVPDCWK